MIGIVNRLILASLGESDVSGINLTGIVLRRLAIGFLSCWEFPFKIGDIICCCGGLLLKSDRLDDEFDNELSCDDEARERDDVDVREVIELPTDEGKFE